MTVSVSVERYLSIRNPNYNHSIKKYLIPFPIGFALLYNLPKFFEFVTCNDTTSIPELHPINLSFPNVTDRILSVPLQNNISSGINSSQPNVNAAPFPHSVIQEMLDAYYRNRINVTENNLLKEMDKTVPKRSLIKDVEESVDCEDKHFGVTQLRKNRWYIILYVFGCEVFLVEVLPWVTIVVLTILTWRGIKKFQDNRKRFIRSHSLGKH